MVSETTTNSRSSGEVVPPVETDQPERAPTPPSAGTRPPTTTDTSVQAEASKPQGVRIEISADKIKKPSEVDRDDPNINVVDLPPRTPTFKEQVYGYARIIRGTVLGQPSVKEQGAEVLRGERGIPMRRGSQSK